MHSIARPKFQLRQERESFQLVPLHRIKHVIDDELFKLRRALGYAGDGGPDIPAYRGLGQVHVVANAAGAPRRAADAARVRARLENYPPSTAGTSLQARRNEGHSPDATADRRERTFYIQGSG